MNEQIKELVAEVGIHFSAHYQHQGVDTAVIIPSDLEKFAELIVKECANLCQQEATKEANNVWERTRAACDAQMIREHFGVEE